MSKEFFDIDVVASHTMQVDHIKEQKNDTREFSCEITHTATGNEEVNVTSIIFTSEYLLLGSTPHNHYLFVTSYAKGKR